MPYTIEAQLSGNLGSVLRVVAERHALQCAVIGRLVSGLARGVPEILQHENPHRTGAAAAVARCLDLADQTVDVLPLTPADFGQRIPQFGFQAHAGATALRHDVSIDQATAWHGCPLSEPPTGKHRHAKKRLSLRSAMGLPSAAPSRTGW